MLKTILIKINSLIFVATENIFELMKKIKNRYLAEAIKYCNIIQKRKVLACFVGHRQGHHILEYLC